MTISGNLGGVLPGVGARKKLWIPASVFGGVSANTWRPLRLSSFIYTWIPLFDLYPRSAVEVYVHWSSLSSTTTNTATWRVRYRSTTPDADSVLGSFSALSTVIAADSPAATANFVMRTAPGVIAPGLLVPDELYTFEVGVTAVSGLTLGNTSNVEFVGLELRYAQGRLM